VGGAVTLDEKRAILEPLVAMLCTSHCWVNHRHRAKPFTVARLEEHLAGTHKYGLCPIKPGESTCRVALLDLDSHKGETTWADMRKAADRIAFELEQAGYAPALFRSSGGQGIHIILTWTTPQEAYPVREMLSATIERAGFSAGTAGVAHGEIEVFPRQNAVASDACGNMFLLPFAGTSEVLT